MERGKAHLTLLGIAGPKSEFAAPATHSVAVWRKARFIEIVETGSINLKLFHVVLEGGNVRRQRVRIACAPTYLRLVGRAPDLDCFFVSLHERPEEVTAEAQVSEWEGSLASMRQLLGLYDISNIEAYAGPFQVGLAHMVSHMAASTASVNARLLCSFLCFGFHSCWRMLRNLDFVTRAMQAPSRTDTFRFSASRERCASASPCCLPSFLLSNPRV